MSNSISFVGRLGNDAELKHIGENTVLEFSLANDVGFKEKKLTNWFRCSFWGKRGQSLAQFLVKGKQIALQIETLTTEGGQVSGEA